MCVCRDLKPENILLQPYNVVHKKASSAAPTPGEKRYVVKITDFGMARMADSAGISAHGPLARPTTGAQLSRMNTIVGTESYLSTELRSRHEGCHASDLESNTERAFLKALGVAEPIAVAGARRARKEKHPALDRLRAGVFNDPSLPKGWHYFPSSEDFSAIEDSHKRGYTEAVDSWSLGVILVRSLAT
jgi:serine/threonine protein kinase